MSDTLQKCCTGPCGRILPATTEFFHRDNQKKDGLRCRCKECTRSHVNAHQSHPEIQERRRAYMTVYNHLSTVVERRPAYQKSYYRRPGVREHRRVQGQGYRSRREIREQRRSYQQRYRNRTGAREHQQVYAKAYYSDPKRHDQVVAYGRHRSARKKSVSGTYTPTQIRDLLKRQKYRCYYCSTTFKREKGKYRYHVDHTFPLSRVAGSDIPANNISYLVLTCPTCNLKKGDRFPWEFPEGGRLL